MINVTDDRLYTKEHAWIRRQGDGRCDVGLSGYAIEAFAGLAYFSFLVKIGDKVKIGDDLADIESRKSADTLKCPVNGVVEDFGGMIEKDPSCLEDCDGATCILLIKEEGENKDLMTRKEYDEYVKTL